MEQMTALAPSQAAKCSYVAERSAVLSQLSILVGYACVAAKWACGAGPHPGNEWDFYCNQLRLVCGFHLQELTLHAHEWAAQSLWIGGYKGGLCRIP